MKIMLLAILPNWNSLDSVRRAHSDLELAGLVFFALLVVAEALAHNSKQEERKHLFDSIGIWFFAVAVLCEIAGYWYGQRNDDLSEQVIVSLDAKARDAASNASTALSNSKEAEAKSSNAADKAGKAQIKVDAVAKRAEEIDTDLTAVDWIISARRIQDVDGLTSDLKREFRGRHMILTSYAGLSSDESFWLCSQLVEIAKNAEVDGENECANEPIRGVPVTDLSIRGPNHAELEKLSTILAKPRGIIGYFVGMSERPVLTILVGARGSIPTWPPKRLGVPASKNNKNKNGKP